MFIPFSAKVFYPLTNWKVRACPFKYASSSCILALSMGKKLRHMAVQWV